MRDIPGYQAIKKLAEGHDRVVYSALRASDDKPVVLKALRSEHPSADMLALMYHEYEMTKDLDVPGIIQTYALIEKSGQCTLVQEDMQGISLYEFLKEHPIKELGQFFKLALQMTKILGELHQCYIIHKDIKPSNFIIHPKTLAVKLTDFNYSSKLLHETQGIVPPSKLEGTLAYMAPEQTGRMNMNIDYRADFYALGVTFFEMLTGELPFLSADPMELLHAHLAEQVPDLLNPIMNIPPVLSQIIQKLMAKNPSERYQSTIGLLADLTQCVNEFENNGKIETFLLGQRDVFDRLNLSQKLYGREHEAKTLLTTYDRVSQGEVEALMVCGYSGIGKTMLINEVHKPMVQHKGYFISGKFDQLQRNTPYTAMTQAFNQLAKLILAEPEWRFEEIKKGMIEILGSVGQVIIDLAPSIELIIGPQPPLEKLPPQETQNRMMILFKRFMSVIANKNHPLVLFIDDLQWADSSSLTLLKYILTDDELSHVLLIGAYRDNEVDEHHILRQFFKEMEGLKKNISSLPLGPLNVKNFEAFFMDSFNRDEEAVKPFSALIHKRTEGNPFFCKQVISEIYKEGLLFFDYNQHRWDWSLEAITALKITDNVVDLMLAKLAKLPENTQALLKLASCVGSRFGADLLMAVSGQSPDEIALALWPALQQELILSLQLGYKRMHSMPHENRETSFLNDIQYQFAHDRVQQSVYQGISPLDKNRAHLLVARTLLEKEPEACKKERLFEVTDHFNEAGDLLEPSEKLQVADLNYQAGLKAFTANAYHPMLNYLCAALNLTKSLSWEEHHEFLFNLNLAYVESLYLTHSLEEAIKLTEALLKRAKSPLEEANIYMKQNMYAVFSGNIGQSVAIGLKALKILGIKLPSNPSRLRIGMKAFQIKYQLRKYNLNTLENDLPPIRDKEIIAALELMTNLVWGTFWGGGSLFLYLPLVGLEIILRHGMHESFAVWVMVYSFLLLNTTKNVNQGFELFHLADRLLQHAEHKGIGFAAYFIQVYYLDHLRLPFEAGRINSQHLINLAREIGSSIFGSAGRVVEYEIARCEAKSMSDVIKAAENGLSFCQHWQLTDLSAIMKLRLSIPQAQAAGAMEFDSQLAQYQSIFQGKNVLISTIASMMMAYHFFFLESYENVLPYDSYWWAQENRMRYILFTNTQKTFDALSIAKCIPNLSYSKRYRYRRRISQIYKDLKWAAKQCPHNYLHQFLMLVGIKAEFKGSFDEAIDAFEKAAENAKRGNFYLWAAIANEWAGDLFIRKNHIRGAKSYIGEAHYYYERYGMTLKANALEKRYPECFVERVEVSSPASGMGGSGLYTTATTTTSAALDFMSVIKASQAISGEIIIDKLFEKILHILLENAGAEKSYFLEKNKNIWMVTAILARQQNEEKFEMLNTPLKEFENLPLTMLQYSLRSEEAVVLSDAAEDSQYRQDPYILRAQPKSVLCLPVLHHDRALGIIYLENNLTIGAFTQDRITVLSALASQIAISLENARHFEVMENLYRSTERFVPKGFLQLLKKATIEEIKVGDSAEVNLAPMFADIRNFTTISEALGAEKTAYLLNSYMQKMSPIIRQRHGFVSQFFGDGIMALFPRAPVDAVNAAIEMHMALFEVNALVQAKGYDPIEIGIGITTGPAMLITLGEEERIDPSVVSDVVNSAARIEALNKHYGTGLLISDAVYQSLENPEKYPIRLIDRVKVKGKKRALDLYEVMLLLKGEDLLQVKNDISEFEAAFAYYQAGNFKAAEKAFDACLNKNPKDTVSSLLKQRCTGFLLNGPPKDWDGTWTLLEK